MTPRIKICLMHHSLSDLLQSNCLHLVDVPYDNVHHGLYFVETTDGDVVTYRPLCGTVTLTDYTRGSFNQVLMTEEILEPALCQATADVLVRIHRGNGSCLGNLIEDMIHIKYPSKEAGEFRSMAENIH